MAASYRSTQRDPSGKPLVSVEKVTKKFLHEGHEVPVLRGIDLVIEQGEMLSVVGPSGAGKSTLLHILGTLDLPTSGRICYDGRDVTGYSSAQLSDFRNRSIGFVFQFHHLLPEFTALENVMMPGMIRGSGSNPVSAIGATLLTLVSPTTAKRLWPERFDGSVRFDLRKRATELLKEVGLGHRMSHRPGELSGGEQQRVALARALIMEPKLVLADEPTGNLDSKTSEAIHKLFFDMNQQRGTTFLIVTHSLTLAARMPRVVTMRDGHIVSDERRAPEAPAEEAQAEEGQVGGALDDEPADEPEGLVAESSAAEEEE